MSTYTNLKRGFLSGGGGGWGGVLSYTRIIYLGGSYMVPGYSLSCVLSNLQYNVKLPRFGIKAAVCVLLLALSGIMVILIIEIVVDIGPDRVDPGRLDPHSQ